MLLHRLSYFPLRRMHEQGCVGFALRRFCQFVKGEDEYGLTSCIWHFTLASMNHTDVIVTGYTHLRRGHY